MVRQACTFTFPAASRGDALVSGSGIAGGRREDVCFCPASPPTSPFSLDTSRYHDHSNQILLCEAPPVSTTLHAEQRGLCVCVGVCLRVLPNRQKPLRTGTLK